MNNLFIALDIAKTGKLCLITMLMVMTVGCSLQFRQLDLINEIMDTNSDPQQALDDAEWQAQWNNQSYTLYAINASDTQTLFAFDKQLLISLDDSNITYVMGFLPSDDIGRMEMQGEELLYFVNDRLIARHNCEPWATMEQSDGGIQHYQACQGREPYTNEIDIDTEGMVIRLHYLLHPEYPPMTMVPATSDN